MGKVLQKNSVKDVRHPFSNKLMKEVYVIGNGLFRRNTAYKTYNSVKDNSILMTTDLSRIDWNKSK